MNTDETHNRFEDYDTIVVPAHPKGFQDVFMEEQRWPNLKVDGRRLSSIKYIAIYQTSPVSAITHVGTIETFEPLERKGRYNVRLSGRPKEINSVKYTNADVCAVQGPRYSTLELVENAASLSRAFPT